MGVAVRPHVHQQFCYCLRRHVGLERPRCIRVPDGPCNVGYVLEHVTLVDELVVHFEPLTVQRQFDTPERLELQSGCGDDDVGGDLVTRFQPDPVGGDLGYPVGHHGRAAGANGLEEIAVRHDAQPLVPRGIRRLEVLVDIVSTRKLRLRHRSEHPAGRLRRTSTQLIRADHQQRIAPPQCSVREGVRQHTLSECGERIGHRQGRNVRG
ncbi:unannotated protein [freshwater metagenome]|uniref:Unannotated protein n=1 Tax=freshwater metagenome TaxID=449393 RepID=A0A6J7HZW2_9ZZZZ